MVSVYPGVRHGPASPRTYGKEGPSPGGGEEVPGRPLWALPYFSPRCQGTAAPANLDSRRGPVFLPPRRPVSSCFPATPATGGHGRVAPLNLLAGPQGGWPPYARTSQQVPNPESPLKHNPLHISPSPICYRALGALECGTPAHSNPPASPPEWVPPVDWARCQASH